MKTILLCAICTSFLKIFPMAFINKRQINPRIIRFFNVIPYTSLSILIIRSILTTEGKMLIPTIASGIVAVIVMLKKENVVLSILFGVVVSYFILMIR